jgi:hypothetical protein
VARPGTRRGPSDVVTFGPWTRASRAVTLRSTGGGESPTMNRER